jgi:hypothetical protein
MAIEKKLKINNGFSVVELMVVVSIIATTFVGLLEMIGFSLGISTLMKQTLQANNIAQETMEAVRNFRDGTDWGTNGLGTLSESAYHPEICSPTSFPSCDPSKWQLISNTKTIGIFTQKVVFQNAWRDANNDIADGGINEDLNTKKAIVTVSWQEKNRNHQVEITTYLANW